MIVRYATEAGPGAADNEDAVFVVGDLVGVLDGVSVPAGVETGCVHNAAWYVQHLSQSIQHFYLQTPDGRLPELLARAITRVRLAHTDACDPDHPGGHAATVSLIRHRQHELDLLLLCDGRLVLDRAGEIDVVSDPRFTNAVAALRRAAFQSAPAIGTAEQHERVVNTALARQALVNTPDGYWIAAADPSAAEHAITETIDTTGRRGVRRAALLTDGAADLVERYGLLAWPDLLDLAQEAGPEAVIRMVREAEHADPEGRARPRYKRHDDATIALCTFERSSS